MPVSVLGQTLPLATELAGLCQDVRGASPLVAGLPRMLLDRGSTVESLRESIRWVRSAERLPGVLRQVEAVVRPVLADIEKSTEGVVKVGVACEPTAHGALLEVARQTAEHIWIHDGPPPERIELTPEQVRLITNVMEALPPIAPDEWNTLRARLKRETAAQQAGEPPDAQRPARDTATVNARMIDTMQRMREARDWTARLWADHLGCSPSTVATQPAWAELMKFRAGEQMARGEAYSGRKLPKKRR